MIPSIDTHMYDQINRRLRPLLKECYIIHEALKDIDEEAREDFMNTFCGDKPKRTVLLSYQYPQAGQSFDAMYVIRLGSGEESIKSIGGVEGGYEFRQGTVKRETHEIQLDTTSGNLFILMDERIGSIEGIPSLSLFDSNMIETEGNYIMFDYDPSLLGLKVEVIYTTEIEESPELAGVKKGFTTTEDLTVVSMSYNYDTVRCLDAILKVILISMREAIPEQTYYGLQGIKFSPMQVVIPDGERPVFGRPVGITYTVSYSLDFDFYQKINEIIIREDR